MSNLPNPDLTKSTGTTGTTGTRKIHQPSEPLPPPVEYQGTPSDDLAAQDRLGGNIPKQERPLGVQPAQQGDVAFGGYEGGDLPTGKASTADKMIGKTQKVAGKMTKNPEMHEKGELREAGGKAAVTGHARAPHD